MKSWQPVLHKDQKENNNLTKRETEVHTSLRSSGGKPEASNEIKGGGTLSP